MDDPEFVADHRNPGGEVVGVSLDGEVKAYPIRHLNYHEIGNDTVGGCPST